MPPKVFQASEFKEEIKGLLKNGTTVEDVIAKKYPVSERTIWRYAKEVQEEKKNAEDEKKGLILPGEKVVKGPVPLATITSKGPAPIIFRMGDLNIDLEPQALYDAFRYCEDIKRIDPAVTENFSEMLKIAAKNMWERFSQFEAQRAGVNIEIPVGG